MKTWIGRLFGIGKPLADGAPAPPAAPVAAAAVETIDSVDADAGLLPATADARIEQLYWRWLCGALPPAEGGAGTARRLLDELARLDEAPQDAAALVPRVPEVLPQLLRSMRDDSVSAAELARQLARDPVLVAEVIREANSPYYRSSAQVRTIDAALLVLGLAGLRMLLARAAFRPVIGMQNSPRARAVAPVIWRHTELRARCSALLATRLRADPVEAYLAGLMQDLGLVVAFRVLDRIDQGIRVPQDEAFADAVLARARRLSARIARVWEMPPPIVAAIVQAGDTGAAQPPLALSLADGERLARLRHLADAGAAEARAALARLDPASAQVLARLRL